MPAYEVPSYIKPRSRIASGLLPMAYVSEERAEYISDLKNAVAAVKDTIRAYMRYEMLTMRKDLRGNPEAFKVYPDVNSMVRVPIEEFIEEATGGKELHRFKGEFNLFGQEGLKLVEEVYNGLSADFRVQINLPTQWLVYVPSRRLLTRMCFVVRLGGEIVVRPYGSTNVLLEVESIQLDKVNQPDIRVLKRNAEVKERLNNHWRSIVATQEMAEALEGFETEEAEGGAEAEGKPEEVGEVE